MKKLLPIIVVLAAVGVGAYIFLGKNGGGIAEKASDAFTGSLRAAVEKGVPMKCTYTVEGNEYEGLIKGENWRGKMKSADGKVGEVIIKDDCMWSWDPEKKEGVKMCSQAAEESAEGETAGSVWDQGSFDAGGVEYRCVPTVVTDSQFEPPSDVKFMDLSQFGQQ